MTLVVKSITDNTKNINTMRAEYKDASERELKEYENTSVKGAGLKNWSESSSQ